METTAWILEWSPCPNGSQEFPESPEHLGGLHVRCSRRVWRGRGVWISRNALPVFQFSPLLTECAAVAQAVRQQIALKWCPLQLVLVPKLRPPLVRVHRHNTAREMAKDPVNQALDETCVHLTVSCWITFDQPIRNFSKCYIRQQACDTTHRAVFATITNPGLPLHCLCHP